MDDEADNYDIQANVDDGTCEYLGCTNVQAVNYNSSANVDDGSCDFGPWGPLEPTGSNHNIAIPTYANLTFDGDLITAGDWIGLFYTLDNTGELINGGSTEKPAESITSHSIILSSISSEVYLIENSTL